MDTSSEILLILGRIEGRIEGDISERHKLSDRISRLEQWQSRLKGAWIALAGVCAVLSKAMYGK